MKPLRVLQITTSDLSLEYLLRPQLEALRARGHSVVLASAPGASADRLSAAGWDFRPLHNAYRGWDLRRDVALLFELMRLVRDVAPDVVHTHAPKTSVLGRIAARLKGTRRVINTCHGLYATPDDRLRKRMPVYAIERFAAAFSHLELVQNSEDFALLQRLRVPRARLRLLGNGVDLERFHAPSWDERRHARQVLGIGTDEMVVAGIGRLTPEKGWYEFARALKGLPEITGIIAGPAEGHRERGMSAEELAPVRLVGWVERIELVYWASDIVAVPSWREGMPRAAMEGAACGIPVVGADARGVREVVDDGRTGFLHPIRDSDNLAARVQQLAADTPLRAAFGSRARARAEELFDERRIVERVVVAIEEGIDADVGNPDL